MKRILVGWLVVTTLASRALGQGTVLWDEAVNGPLAQSSASPTPLFPMQFGTNSLIGASEIEPTGGIWFAYHDFFTLAVPDDLRITSIQLQVDKPNVWMWIGDSTFGNQLEFVMNPSTGDLLPQWNLSSILPGIYGMYVGNTDSQPFVSIANYRLDFVVQAIPEPASLWLLLGGLGCLGLHRWRKS